MKNRFWLLWWCLVVLSLCLSPSIPYVSFEGYASLESAAEPAHGGEALYVPPVRAGMQLAPTLGGSVAASPGEGAAAMGNRAPLIIETPEPDFLALEFDGAYAFVLQGAGEPGAQIELIANNRPQSRRVATVDPEGRWEIGAAREDMRVGEVHLALRYVHDWDSEVIWRSRLPDELPELLLPAFVGEGTRRLTGYAQGDVRVEASAEGRTLLTLQNRDGSFSVAGVADLAAGSEVLLTATDALGNVAEAVSMVVRPESALLHFSMDAPQVHRYLSTEAGFDARAKDEPTARPTFGPTAQPTLGPTAQPTFGPTAQPTLGPTAQPTFGPTTRPTLEPTARPTVEPTARPTLEPTTQPTVGPTVQPTPEPTVNPFATPAPMEIDAKVPAQIAQMIRIAQREEARLGGERIPRNNKYTAWFYQDERRVGWASTFVGWCANEAGLPLFDGTAGMYARDEALDGGAPMVASESKASLLYSTYKSADRLGAIPLPGYVIIYGVRGSTPATHVGIVESVVYIGNGVFELTTLEGNVSNTVKRYCFRYELEPRTRHYNLQTVPRSERVHANAQYKWQRQNWYVSGFGQTWR